MSKRLALICLLSSLVGCAASSEYQRDGGTLVYESITPPAPNNNQNKSDYEKVDASLWESLAKLDLAAVARVLPRTIKAFTAPDSFDYESLVDLGYPAFDWLNGPTKQRLAQIEAERGATVKRAYLPLHAKNVMITDGKLKVLVRGKTERTQ